MLVEKYSRFFRKYEFRFAPRHIGAPVLPLVGTDKEYSIHDALQIQIKAEKALDVQSNGDVIEIMQVQHLAEKGALVLLIHRASPYAAEPVYRRKARLEAGSKVTIREAEKAADEVQTVSAHLVILSEPNTSGLYRAALEEIPGISMAAVRPIIGQALNSYKYEFEKGKKVVETYTTFKPEGIKSETMTNALKGGKINNLTLTRPAKPDFVDAEGIFRPEQETMRIRVTGVIESSNWREKLGSLLARAKKNGWADFKIDMDLDDSRNRTVKVDRDISAEEILFIRSELAQFETELPSCSIEIIGVVVEEAIKIAKMK